MSFVVAQFEVLTVVLRKIMLCGLPSQLVHVRRCDTLWQRFFPTFLLLHCFLFSTYAFWAAREMEKEALCRGTE